MRVDGDDQLAQHSNHHQHQEVDEKNLTRLIADFKSAYPVEAWSTWGFFDESYLETINSHWLSFPPPARSSHYVLATIYIAIMIVGVSGNAFVIFMFLRRPSLRTPANTLVMNLAISDGLMMIKMPIFIFNSFHLGPALGNTGCLMYGFFGGLSGTTSICTLAAISLDRYYVIKFPLAMRFTKIRAKVCVIVAWCYGAFFSAVPLLGTRLGTYVPEGYLTSCSFDYLTDSADVRAFIFVFFVAAWLAPFLLIAFCYINIFSAVLNARKLTRENSESSRHVKTEDGGSRQELKLALTVLGIVALWFIAWTPYAVVSLLGIAGCSHMIRPLTSMIPALFCKTAACADPFIYAITSTKFKSEIVRLCSRSTTKESSMNTFSAWAIQGSKRKLSSRKRSIYAHSCQASDEIETIDVVIPTFEQRIRESKGFRKASPRHKNDRQSLARDNARPPPWWCKPNFSNSNSSLKDVAKTWMIRQRQENMTCDYCEVDFT